MIVAYIDGGCAPKNPGGVGAWGIHAFKDGEGIYVAGGICGEGPQMSNNVAEYHALLRLFNYLDKLPLPEDETVEVRSDSQLLVNQMSGEWRIKKGLYVDLARKAYRRLKGVYTFKWIPRDENLADKQVRVAHDRVQNQV